MDILYASELQGFPKYHIDSILHDAHEGTRIKEIYSSYSNKECRIIKRFTNNENKFIQNTLVWFMDGKEVDEIELTNIIVGDNSNYYVGGINYDNIDECVGECNTKQQCSEKYTSKLYMNEDFSNTVGSDDESKYIPTYECVVEFYDVYDMGNYFSGVIDNLNEEINYDNKYINILLDDRNDVARFIPVFSNVEELKNLPELPAYEFLSSTFEEEYFSYLDEEDKSRASEIKEEIKKELNYTNNKLRKFADEWGFEKVKDKSSINESYYSYNDVVVYRNREGNVVADIDYTDITVHTSGDKIHYNAEEPYIEYGETDEIEYTFHVDTDDLIEALIFVVKEEDIPENIPLDSDEFYEYLENNAGTLAQKYNDEIVEYFRNQAETEASKNIG